MTEFKSITGDQQYVSSGINCRMASKSAGMVCPSALICLAPSRHMDAVGKLASAKTWIQSKTSQIIIF